MTASHDGSRKNGNDSRPCGASVGAHPVGRRAVPAAGEAVEHVADVADQGVRAGGHVDPGAVGPSHLQAAERVLGQQGQEPVVGVLGHAPALDPGRDRRVVERPEQHHRIGGEVLGEPRRRRGRARRRGRRSTAWPTPGRPRPSTRRRPAAGRPAPTARGWGRGGAARTRPAGRTGQVDADVEALLLVGHAGRQLAAHGEPPSPRPSAPGHGDLGLALVGEGEEGPGRGLHARQQGRIDAVPDDGGEAVGAEGDVQGVSRGVGTRPDLGDHRAVIGEERSDVDDGDGGHLPSLPVSRRRGRCAARRWRRRPGRGPRRRAPGASAPSRRSRRRRARPPTRPARASRRRTP